MKTRYRLEYRRFKPPLVVLQVGEDAYANYDPARDLAPRKGNRVTRWRDARPEDLMNGDRA